MRKISQQEIMELLCEMNLTLDTHEIYKDCFTRMLCYTQEGYKLLLSYHENIKRKKIPHFVSKYNPFTIENMKLWVKNNEPDYVILDNEYISSDFSMAWRIKNSDLPDFKMSWTDFYSIGRRHPHFSKQRELDHANNLRKTPEQVRQEVEYFLSLNGNEQEWELNGNEEYNYKTSRTKLKFTDKNGYKSEMTLMNLRNGKNPVYFHKKLIEISTYNLYKWIEENTPYKLAENQTYRGNSESYVFICNIHGEFKKILATMKNNGICDDCWLGKISGENSHLWNENLTEEQRIENRDYNEYIKWRKAVYERDKYTCQCCGEIGGNINAHHLNGYNWHISGRTDVNNGTTLCENCHNDFHLIYGFGDNTKEQYVDWINSKSNFIF
jgi:hypothetical protein